MDAPTTDTMPDRDQLREKSREELFSIRLRGYGAAAELSRRLKAQVRKEIRFLADQRGLDPDDLGAALSRTLGKWAIDHEIEYRMEHGCALMFEVRLYPEWAKNPVTVKAPHGGGGDDG